MKSVQFFGWLVLGFFAVGCADDVEPTTENVVVNRVSEAVSPIPVTIDVGDGLRFLDITANGTGCPPLMGLDKYSWEANISPDGETFTITFSQYEATVNPTTPLFVTKDCTLGINVRVPNGFTYAVSAFDYGGYVFLDSVGMRATQKAEYYFQGDQIRSVNGNTLIIGPESNDYILHDEISTASLVWAPCGASRLLNVKTRLTLQNNTSKTGTGYINTSVIDGRVTFTINLKWALCTETK